MLKAKWMVAFLWPFVRMAFCPYTVLCRYCRVFHRDEESNKVEWSKTAIFSSFIRYNFGTFRPQQLYSQLCSPSLAFQWPRNRSPWMNVRVRFTLEFALLPACISFIMLSLSDTTERKQRYAFTVKSKFFLWSPVFDNILIMRILAGVLRAGGFKQHGVVWICDMS